MDPLDCMDKLMEELKLADEDQVFWDVTPISTLVTTPTAGGIEFLRHPCVAYALRGEGDAQCLGCPLDELVPRGEPVVHAQVRRVDPGPVVDVLARRGDFWERPLALSAAGSEGHEEREGRGAAAQEAGECAPCCRCSLGHVP